MQKKEQCQPIRKIRKKLDFDNSDEGKLRQTDRERPMNKENEKHFGLRVDGEILAKFRYVCGYVGRSANSQIIQLMLKFIQSYEKEHGKIDLEEISK